MPIVILCLFGVAMTNLAQHPPGYAPSHCRTCRTTVFLGSYAFPLRDESGKRGGLRCVRLQPIAQKRRDDLSCERSPLTFRFFEDPVRYPDHNYSSLQSYSGLASRARRSPYSVITFRCKSFLVPCAASGFPSAA